MIYFYCCTVPGKCGRDTVLRDALVPGTRINCKPDCICALVSAGTELIFFSVAAVCWI